MPTVTNTVVDAAGQPAVGAHVTIRLAGSWSADGAKETLPQSLWTGTTDASGVWSVSLPAQSAYEGDTYYLAREPGASHTFTVADTPSSQRLRDRLTTPVTPATAVGLTLDGLSDVSTSAAVAGQVLTKLNDGSWGATSAAGVTAHSQLTGLAAPADDHTQYQLRTEKAASGGYPSLDGSTKVPIAQLPTGTSGSTVPVGNDSRFTDARTPTSHATSHATAGSDPVSPAAIGAATSAHTHTGTYAVVPKIRQAWITDGSGSTLPDTAGAWAVVSGFSLSIPAAVGDWVQLGVHAMRSATATASLDVAVVVSGTIVRYLASGTSTPALEGDPGFYLSSSFVGQSAPRGFIAVSGDLDSGNVVFRLVAKTSAAAGTVFASSSYPFYWAAENKGPVA